MSKKATKKSPVWEWVVNPNYREDYCQHCGEWEGDHFKVVTPNGIVALCGKFTAYEGHPSGEYKIVDEGDAKS